MRIVVTIMGFCLTAGFMPSMANAVDSQIIESRILLKEIASIQAEVVDLRAKFIGSGGIIPVLKSYVSQAKGCGKIGRLHKGGTACSPGNNILKDAEFKGSQAYSLVCTGGYSLRNRGVLDKGSNPLGSGGSNYIFCVK